MRKSAEHLVESYPENLGRVANPSE